jgi:hypothetical protein
LSEIIQFIDGIPQTNKKLNGYFEVQKKQDRNGKFLKKYWELMAFTAHHIPEGINYNVNLDNCTKDLLHEIIKGIQGVESISFAKMTEDDFNKHYSNTLDHCCKLLGTSPEIVIQELVGFF